MLGQDVRCASLNGFTTVTSGAYHACVLNEARAALCWGQDQFGQGGHARIDYSGGPSSLNWLPVGSSGRPLTRLPIERVG